MKLNIIFELVIIVYIFVYLVDLMNDYAHLTYRAKKCDLDKENRL